MLGTYRVLDELTRRFPDVLFEGCSGGGGRFDAGMLYYSPQIWASDDTDAVERIKIQYGTSLVYPLVSISAHVSAVPNNLTGQDGAWMVVSEDQSEAAVFYFRFQALPNAPLDRHRLAGLDAGAVYRDERGDAYSGAQLMNFGLHLPETAQECVRAVWYFM